VDLSEFDYRNPVSKANEANVIRSMLVALRRQLTRYPTTDEQDAAIIKDKKLFRLLSYTQRMSVRHRRNEKRLLKKTIAALEARQIRDGLDLPNLPRAEGSTLGVVLPTDEKRYGMKPRTKLEQRLEKMGMPVDIDPSLNDFGLPFMP